MSTSGSRRSATSTKESAVGVPKPNVFESPRKTTFFLPVEPAIWRESTAKYPAASNSRSARPAWPLNPGLRTQPRSGEYFSQFVADAVPVGAKSWTTVPAIRASISSASSTISVARPLRTMVRALNFMCFRFLCLFSEASGRVRAGCLRFFQ